MSRWWGQVPFIAHEGCHEMAGKHTCDKRMALTKLKALYPQVTHSLVHSFAATSTQLLIVMLSRSLPALLTYSFAVPLSHSLAASLSQILQCHAVSFTHSLGASGRLQSDPARGRSSVDARKGDLGARGASCFWLHGVSLV